MDTPCSATMGTGNAAEFITDENGNKVPVLLVRIQSEQSRPALAIVALLKNKKLNTTATPRIHEFVMHDSATVVHRLAAELTTLEVDGCRLSVDVRSDHAPRNYASRTTYHTYYVTVTEVLQ